MNESLSGSLNEKRNANIALIMLPVCFATTSMKPGKSDIRLILGVFVAACLYVVGKCISRGKRSHVLLATAVVSLQPSNISHKSRLRAEQ